MVNPYWRKLIGYARTNNALIHVPLPVDEQKSRPNNLKSSLIKSSLKKTVSFGGVEERLYEVGSACVTEGDIFPDLTRLVPVQAASALGDKMSDGECSAQDDTFHNSCM